MISLLKKIIKIFLIIIFLFGLLVGSIELYKATQGNFHSVTEGEFYRSAKLDRGNYEYYIKEKGIKTIINLQGKKKNNKDYNDALAVSKEQNVTHIDYGMSAYAFYDINRTKEIVEIMKNAQKPILVHCHGGADRSALVSALWLYAVKNKDVDESRRQFKLLYGYFPYLMWDKKKNMRRSFESYYNMVEKE